MGVLDKLDKRIAEEKSGGGGIIGKVSLDIGFKVFVKGESNFDTFFIYDLEDDSSKEKAKAAATKFLKKAGLEGKKSSHSIQIVIFKEHVLDGNITNWNDDRYIQCPDWTDDWEKTGYPGLEKAINDAEYLDQDDVFGKTHWARISGKPELTGKTYTAQDSDGNDVERPSMYQYVAEFYETKNKAQEAAGDASTQSSSEEVDDSPPGMTSKNWNRYKKEILKEVANTELDEVCEDYGITDVKWLRRYCKTNEIEFTE